MKNFAIKLVWFTTIYLVVFAMLCQFDISLPVLFSMLIAGQGLLLFMVYKVLTDSYTTHKTFKDWYEDRPVKTLDEEK